MKIGGVIHIFIGIAALLFVSCEPRPPEPFVDISSARVQLDYRLDTIEVVVRTNYEWSASVADEWCELLARENDSVMRIAVAWNEGAALRQTTVTVVSQEIKAEFLIIQTAYPGGYGRFRDSTALVDLYRNCGGDQWEFYFETKPLDSWVLKNPITTWTGVATERVEGAIRVVSLDLSAVGLRGKVPESFTQLTELNALSLSTYLDLELDAGLLAQLPRLQLLDLSQTNFVPALALPDDLGFLSNLVYLDLSGIDFGGSMPRNIEKIKALQYLMIDNCNIGGGFPSVLRSFSGLKTLSANFNPMESILPAWIGDLTYLESLELAGCDLTGAIPVSVGQLKKLNTLKLGYNKFSGSIPREFGQLTRLETLNLSECGLSGAIPAEIANAANLDYIDLSFNDLDGGIPAVFGTLRFLEYLALGGNRLSGEIPSALLISPLWNDWYVCPQQEGYGFSNCNF